MPMLSEINPFLIGFSLLYKLNDQEAKHHCFPALHMPLQVIQLCANQDSFVALRRAFVVTTSSKWIPARSGISESLLIEGT